MKKVASAAEARKNEAKKRSLHVVNEHFEPNFDAASASAVVFQRADKCWSGRGGHQRYEINAHGFRMVSIMITLGRAASIAIFFIYNMTLFYLVVFLQATENIFAENGPMEMSQALLLAITAVIFLISWRQLEKHHKFVLLSCSLLCLTFLLRELDVEDFDLPHFLIVMGSGTGRNIILSTAWVFVAIGAFLNWKYYRGKLTLYFFSKTGILLMTGAGFLLVGALFDHEIITVPYYQFYEELAELNGYYFLLLGALASRASLQGIANHPSS